jgi:hypothetical protein
MRFAIAIVISCTACKGLLGLDDGVIANGDGAIDDAPLDDATIDGMLDASGVCYGTAPFMVCPGAMVGTPSMLASLNTSDAQTCDFVDTTDGRDWCVIVRTDFLILTGISVTGSRPLVLLARNDLTVGLAGMIDVSSRTPSKIGPAANHATCASGNGMAGVQTGAGGAGGSFGSVGGNGGKGSTLGVNGGVAQPVMTSDLLRGGCKGGKGAPGTTNVGGDGGGAIYLVAGGQVRIDGLVNASGAGGMGGRMPGTGGGGGGSGGTIVLAAPVVTVSTNAQVFANGGGGGSGAGIGNDGAPGEEPSSPAEGGAGDSTPTGGAGGRGASRISAAQPGNDDQAGGGGGGGGGGRVRVFATTQSLATGAISPSPS